jgi:hypothetical protein
MARKSSKVIAVTMVLLSGLALSACSSSSNVRSEKDAQALAKTDYSGPVGDLDSEYTTFTVATAMALDNNVTYVTSHNVDTNSEQLDYKVFLKDMPKTNAEKGKFIEGEFMNVAKAYEKFTPAVQQFYANTDKQDEKEICIYIAKDPNPKGGINLHDKFEPKGDFYKTFNRKIEADTALHTRSCVPSTSLTGYAQRHSNDS